MVTLVDPSLYMTLNVKNTLKNSPSAVETFFYPLQTHFQVSNKNINEVFDQLVTFPGPAAKDLLGKLRGDQILAPLPVKDIKL